MIAALMLFLTACALPPDPASNTVPAIEARMQSIASEYVADKERGGMAAVVDDVEHCYGAATLVFTLQADLRNCMILDATGALEDMRASRVFGQNLLFFTEAAKEERFRRYWPEAGFPSPAAAINYVVTGARMVEYDENASGVRHF